MGALAAGVSGYFNRQATNAQVGATDRATQAQSAAAQNAIDEQRRQYDLTRADQLPWLQSGQRALGELDRAATGDLSGFQASPDYQFRRNEGMRDLGNSFAARGGAFGGNAMKALAEFNQNLAGSEFGNWWNRTASRAGVGQSTAANLGNLGANVAGNVGNITTNLGQQIGNNNIMAGNARASGIQANNQAFQNANRNTQQYLGYFFGGGFGG